MLISICFASLDVVYDELNDLCLECLSVADFLISVCMFIVSKSFAHNRVLQ